MGGELIREGGLKGTGWRFSAYSLIKLLFSNLLLILSVNKPTHMIVSGRFQSVFQSRSVFQSNLKQVQKKFVDYANATNAEFIIDPKVLFHGWWIYSHLHISWSSECQGSVQVGSLTTSWYDHIACILACVAWRFCRVGRRSGVAAKFAREARENERRSCKKNNSCPNLLAVSLPSSAFIT